MKAAKLYDKETMLANLLAVNPEPHFQERLYPRFLQAAGSTRNGAGVALMVLLTLKDYVQGMPKLMGVLMLKMAPRFVEAITDDEEVRNAAKELIEG